MRIDFLKRLASSLRPSFIDGERRGARLLFPALLLALLPLAGFPTLAQSKRKPAAPSSQSKKGDAAVKKDDPAAQLARAREDFQRATKDYKESLEQLIAIYQKETQRAEEKLTQTKELYGQGLVSRKTVEEGERAVAEAKAKIDNARQQIVAADERVAETLVEAEAVEQMAKQPPPAKGKLIQATTYIRYMGTGAWSLSSAWQVQQFFQQRFGRPLPVSAFGQSSLHDRWGLDHRNAMDVGVNPGSVEGQALIAFLRANGIPFAAFRAAIFGSATGPHIHIGLPSHRTKPLSSIH